MIKPPETIEPDQLSEAPEHVKLSLDDPAVMLPTADLVGPLAVQPDIPGWKDERRRTERDIGHILGRFKSDGYTFREAHDRLLSLLINARFRPASGLLHEALWRHFPKSPAMCAFRRLLLGSKCSLREDAEREGFSAESVRKSEEKLARTFRLPRPS
jgi:hypothetical protein